MRLADIVCMALNGFVQQKVRTLLSLLGVVVGSFLLVMSLSIGQGLGEGVVRQFQFGDQLRRIQVHSAWEQPVELIPEEKLVVEGAMSDAKRKRIRKALERRWQRDNYIPTIRLNVERLAALAGLEHVETVFPWAHQDAEILFGEGRI